MECLFLTPYSKWKLELGKCFEFKYLVEKYLMFSNDTTRPMLGTRSKSQDAIRNHRKTVRFVSDKQEYQPILDSSNIGGGYRLTHLEQCLENRLRGQITLFYKSLLVMCSDCYLRDQLASKR